MVTEVLQINSTSENYVQKVTGGHLGFRMIKIQGKKMSYHQIDIECDFIDPQNTRNHLLSITLSQIIKNVFKIAYGGHFDFNSLGYKVNALH